MTPKSREALLCAYEMGYRVLDDGSPISPRGKVMHPSPTSAGYPAFGVGSRPQRTVLLHMFAAYKHCPTFLQISGSDDGIYGLDSSGRVWLFRPAVNGGTPGWELLTNDVFVPYTPGHRPPGCPF